VALSALIVAPAAANARREALVDPARTYVEARAASLSGDHVRSAQLLAALAQLDPKNQEIVRSALAEAIGAGDMPLALRLARSLAAQSRPVDARLLLAAEAFRLNRPDAALAYLSSASQEGDLQFFNPLLRAWVAAEQGNQRAALSAIDAIASDNALAPFLAENKAFLLLKFRHSAAAEPVVRKALAAAGGRQQRLRFGFADAYLAAGDEARAMAVLEGLGAGAARARQQIGNGRRTGLAIDSARDAFAELVLALAVDLSRSDDLDLPVELAHIAHYAAPENASTAILLGLLLDQDDRLDAALAAYRSIDESNVLSSQARDAEVQALADAKRFDEALAVAQRAASGRDATAVDFARLGDVLDAMNRYGEAANAYGKAIAAAQPAQQWQYLLMRASTLEKGDHWPQARADLTRALALAPNQPLVLNFLGYTKLERGEDLDAAEAMIRKASELAPDDPSITDSLGWAQFKRGRFKEAIETLQRASRADPAQSEINEHLGDALYTVGRRFEARFAWRAAMVNADEDVLKRLKAKIEGGLTPVTAAP
jgi:tetratricopeptide (TPR) repeat protein